MANRYYVNYPRGFANEYTVYVVNNDDDERELLTHLPHALRITRKRAFYLGRTAPKRAARFGQHWSGGFAYDPTFPIGDPIEDALYGTRDFLQMARAHAAQDALDGALQADCP